MKIYPNCLEIIPNYNAFIVDVWGVIHSGGVLYPNTQNAMQEMCKLGCVYLLSNAPRKSLKVQKFLTGIGIKQGIHYHEILTSGEAFILYAKENKYHKMFYIGPDKDLDVLENTGIDITLNPSKTFDAAIVTGLTDINDLSQDLPALKKLLEKNITLSCINPDIIVCTTNGNQLCAGAVAKEYENMGGNVKYFGKPYSEVYDAVLSKIKGDKILAIGDGMSTDILGANNTKIDSILCTEGIHSNDIKWKGIDAFLAEFTFKPQFVMPHI
ncbi:MAG: HAD superfamily hydrolase (TIGR01459 family) [Candidatus Deianiraeaceae bacterium]|jgi:HAD superfamily hydrolase (TIGR01459 family)